MVSKLTKAKEISETTKKIVLDRQNNKSISGVPLTIQTADFHHVRPRSSSGVGYEWNIVAITREEHRLLHDKQDIKLYGRTRWTWQEFETLIKNHLKIKYHNWTWEKCKYQKYWEIQDYEIECSYKK